MPTIVNIHEAKTHFSKLIEKVLKGEEVIVARAGKPVVKISAIREPVKTSPDLKGWGFAKGQFTVPDNFDDPLPEFEELFYNGPVFPE